MTRTSFLGPGRQTLYVFQERFSTTAKDLRLSLGLRGFFLQYSGIASAGLLYLLRRCLVAMLAVIDQQRFRSRQD